MFKYTPKCLFFQIYIFLCCVFDNTVQNIKIFYNFSYRTLSIIHPLCTVNSRDYEVSSHAMQTKSS